MQQADRGGRAAVKGSLLPVVGNAVAGFGSLLKYPITMMSKSMRSDDAPEDETFEEAIKAYHKMGWAGWITGDKYQK